jgi:hypothetical protein
VRSYRSVILFILAAPLFGLGSVIAASGAREALALLVVAGALLAAAGLTVLRDPDDVANHVKWGWSWVGQGRDAGRFVAALLTLLGTGTSIYGVVWRHQRVRRHVGGGAAVMLPARLLLLLMAVAVPIQVWIDRGALFGVVAALTFAPMMLLGALAHD